ncbi:MAG: hypothetical protein N3A59_08885 [Thermodesulfovibrionales bacterium]|nr:hypothetical protein [Thermodesulfovibrionales bacterium]
MKLFKSLGFLFLIMLFFLFSGKTAYAFILYDDFNNNLINSSLWSDYILGNGPIISEANKRIEITLPTNSTGVVFGAGYKSICQLSGDFDIQVDYMLLTWPPENGVRVGLNAIYSDEISYQVERVSFGPTGDFSWIQEREVYLTHFEDGVKGIKGTNDTSGKLRLKRIGNTFYGYYLDPNINWQTIHAGPAPVDNEVNFGIAAWSHEANFAHQEVKVAFDNFIVNDGELICPIIEVLIDIKPGSFPNSINLKSKGNVSVAILSNSFFDATTIDRNTVIFAGASPLPIGKSYEYINYDELPDVVLHFRTQSLNLKFGDTEACLTGMTINGQSFKGCDSVRIVK